MILLSLVVLAQGGAAPVFVWIDSSTKLSEADVKAFSDQVTAVSPKPQQIVVLVHGFDVPRDDSTAAYNTVSERLQKAFAATNQTVLVVGVQWDSAADASLFDMAEAYEKKVLQARATGRFGMRQVLLLLQSRFPGVPINVMAHSMGCEMAAAALRPDMKFDEATDAAGAYKGGTVAQINSLIMCGSDLDYDAAYKGGVKQEANVKLMWMTMSPLVHGYKDDALKVRSMVRGKAAGSGIPKMTEEQWVRATQAQRLVFDSTEIPRNHAYLDYYSENRLGRIVPAVVYKSDPSNRKMTPELAGIAAVMAAPNSVATIKPFLDSPLISTQIYAICRLEQLLCGGPKHLSDEYIQQEAIKLKDRPKEVRRDVKDSPCQVMKQGFWPTEAEFTKAGAPAWAEKE